MFRTFSAGRSNDLVQVTVLVAWSKTFERVQFVVTDLVRHELTVVVFLMFHRQRGVMSVIVSVIVVCLRRLGVMRDVALLGPPVRPSVDPDA